MEAQYRPEENSTENLAGLSITFDARRFNLHMSNTERSSRLNVETRNSPDMLVLRMQELSSLINSQIIG